MKVGPDENSYSARDLSVEADTDALAHATEQILSHMWRFRAETPPKTMEDVPKGTIVVYAYEMWAQGQPTRSVLFYPGTLHSIGLKNASAIVTYRSAAKSMQEGSIPFDLADIPVRVQVEGRTENVVEGGTTYTVLRQSVTAVPPELTDTLLKATDPGTGLPASAGNDALRAFLHKVHRIDGGGAVPVLPAPGPALAHRVAAQRRSLAALRHFYT